MNHKTKPYWFPAKRYGWGWGLPNTWQGWVVLIIFLAVVSMLGFFIDPNDNSLLFFASIMGCAVVLIGICYAKGEPPKWRWGNSEDDRKNDEKDADGDSH